MSSLLQDGYEKISDAALAAGNEGVPAGKFVAIAYGLIWLAVCLYLVLLARRMAKVDAEIDDLRARVDAIRASEPR